LYKVKFQVSDKFSSQPAELMLGLPETILHLGNWYSVTPLQIDPDGLRFIVLQRVGSGNMEESESSIQVIFNWEKEIEWE